MRSAPEQRLQREVANYLSWALMPPTWFTAIPAGGGGELRGKILKGMGLRAGVPDILIVHDGQAKWLELKSPRGVLSEAQRATHSALNATGCPVVICRSLDEVRGAVWAWGIPLRETKPSLERIHAGFAQPQDWPESDQIGRRKR